MKGNDIYRAYDALRPDEAARERMLRNIQAARLHEDLRRTRRFRGTLLLAAALVLALITTGFATEWFGLASLGQRQEPSDWGSGQETMLRLQGLADSPACQAAEAWNDWCSTYEPDPEDLITPDAPYRYYGCHTEEMIRKLDELAAEYGLSLLPGEAFFPEDEAALLAKEGLTASLLRDTERVQNRYEASYGYSDGTFVMDGTVTFTDGTWLTEPVPYKLYRTMKKTMTVGELNLGDLVVFPYEDWPYGKLLLALGNDRALIVADQTDAFVVVELLGTYYGDIEDGEVHMTRDHIQAIADSFSLAPSDK